MGLPPEIFPKFGGWSQNRMSVGAGKSVEVGGRRSIETNSVVHPVRYGHSSNYQLTIFAVVLSELKKNLDSGVVLGG